LDKSVLSYYLYVLEGKNMGSPKVRRMRKAMLAELAPGETPKEIKRILEKYELDNPLGTKSEVVESEAHAPKAEQKAAPKVEQKAELKVKPKVEKKHKKVLKPKVYNK